MALDNRQFGVKSECEQQTTVLLRSDSRKNPLSLRINIRSNKEPNTDLLYLQIFNKSSNIIFHSFLRPSQCRMMICPDDVTGKSETTIIVYSTETVRSHRHVWHRIIMGGKTTVTLKGASTNNTAVSLQPLKNYQDFCVDATNKIPYHMDVVSTSPQGYMLTDYHYRGGTDGLIVLLHQVYPPESFLVMFRYQSDPTYNLPFVLKPATEYKLQLFRVYTRRSKEDICIGNSHSTVATFTTYMTQAEVRELYMKALAYLSGHRPCFRIITHFYRNKSDEYFANIMTSNGVMYKYDKNWGGEQASSLNKQIKGLFFSAFVDPVTMTPPDISYFGPMRLHIPTYLLLHDGINMYFSDFYCHTVKHKAQLVLTIKGSQTDLYCQQRLVLVDKRNNPFLTRAGYGPFEAVCVTVNITVELFYTEDIPIIAWRNMKHNVYFTRTKQKGHALAMVNGVPKNKDCRICNLDCFRLAHDLV